MWLAEPTVRWAWWLALNIGSLLLFGLAVMDFGPPPAEILVWPGLLLLFSSHAVYRIREHVLADALKTSWQIRLTDLIVAVLLTAILLTTISYVPNAFLKAAAIPTIPIFALAFIAAVFWAGYREMSHPLLRYTYALGLVFRTYGIICVGAVIVGFGLIAVFDRARDGVRFVEQVVTAESRGPAEDMVVYTLCAGFYMLPIGIVLCWIGILLQRTQASKPISTVHSAVRQMRRSLPPRPRP